MASRDTIRRIKMTMVNEESRLSSEGSKPRQLAVAALRGIAGGVFIGAVFFAGYYYRGIDFEDQPIVAPDQYALVGEADLALDEYYLYDLPEDAIRIQGAVRGLVDSLEDPHTRYYEPQIAEVDTTNLAGQFGGIGIEVALESPGLVIIQRVYRDNPAYQAGLEEGDQIVAIDGMTVPADIDDLNGVIAAIRGEVGEPVTLTLQRDGTRLHVTVVRANELIPSSFWRVLEEDSRIGYIQIVRFTERTHEELQLALSELEAAGVSGYVLDLRNNGGGLVDSAVEVAGEFLDGGVLLIEDRGDAGEETVSASPGGSALEQPLVVLVNDASASASEIVAGALQDRGRAILIGQPTTGKGSVQVIIALSDGSSIRITSAQWFTPDRNRIEGTGLQPDITLDPDAPSNVGDPPLESAINYLAQQLSN